MQGFISLHRKLMENPIWGDPNYLKLWIYCLFKASHKEHDQLVGNQVIKLERGEFVTGRFSLAEDMNKGVKPKQKLDELTWWRYLKNLEKFEMLNIKTTNKFSVVTIDKYDFYQDVFNKIEHQTEQQMNIKRTTDEHQLNTNNNVNNGNKGNKKDSCQSFKYETSDMELAKLLFNYIEENVEKAYYLKRVNLESWANTFRLMRTYDGRTNEQIKYLIDWTQKNEFWKTNILSADKLREKFDQLVLKVKAEKEKKVTSLEGKKKKQTDDYGDYQQERKVVSSFDGSLF